MCNMCNNVLHMISAYITSYITRYMLHYNHLLTHVCVSGKLQRTPHNGSLSRAGSMTSLNLGTWGIMEAEAGDEKDKRIRELEETLRKQKELRKMLEGEVWSGHVQLVAWGLLSGFHINVFEVTERNDAGALLVRKCGLRNTLFANAETVNMVLHQQHYHLLAPTAKLMVLETLSLQEMQSMDGPVALTFEVPAAVNEFLVKRRKSILTTATPRERVIAEQKVALQESTGLRTQLRAEWASEQGSAARSLRSTEEDSQGDPKVMPN